MRVDAAASRGFWRHPEKSQPDGPKRLIAGEWQNDRGNASTRGGVRSSRPAVMNDQRGSPKQPVVRRVSDHIEIVWKLNSPRAAPARTERRAATCNGGDDRVAHGVSIKARHAAKADIDRGVSGAEKIP
jgi:hypothetical protein